MICITC